MDITHQRPYINPFSEFLYYAIIFVIPFYKWRTLIEAYPSIKIDYVLAVFLAIILLPHLLTQKKIFEYIKSNVWKWLLLFLVVDFVATVLSPYPHAAWRGFRIIVLICIYVALNLLMITEKGFKKTLPKIVIFSVTIAASTAIIGYVFKLEDWTAPVEVPAGVRAGRGVAVSANNLSLMIVFIFPLLWHWFIYSSRLFSKQIAILLMIINFIGLVSTFSRSGFLLLNITLLLLIFQYRRHFFSIRYLGIILSVFLVVMMAIVLFIPKSYIERQKSLLLGTKADTSIERRADYIPVALDAFKKHPIIGTGMYTFRIIWTKSERAQKLKVEEREAHNTYLDVLVGTGIIGLTLFLALILQCIRNFSRAINIFETIEDEETASIIKAYRISFISILIDFFTYSVIEHNFFVMGIALSGIAVKMAEELRKIRP